MLGRLLLRFAIFGLLAFFVARTLRRFFSGIREGMKPAPPAPQTAKGQAMARDPVCGTFVVPGTALSTRGKSGAVYFCSDTCRQTYLSKA
jgi:YHS domain-containing protein